ncbi:FecR family protein [Larkinella sp. VNQ87]|uniref:FecR family protein n=1 Tax=Larkinella sp. VNQ87 TaxID=3400921 RepID=UPI003C02050F
MQRSRAEYLINRLINNTLSENELDELLAGLGQEEVLNQYSPILEQYFNDLIEQENPDFTAEATHTAHPENLSKHNRFLLPFRAPWGSYGRLAASFVLLLGVGIGSYYFINKHQNQVSHPVGQMSHRPVLSPASTSEEVVPRGKRRNVKLSDGSLVKLNSDSKIRFPKTFDPDVRTVLLEGEAFFDVQRDEARPFSISVGDVKIDVLGTSFNVKDYQDEEEVEITVRSGRVGVSLNSTERDPIILQKDQKLIFNKSTKNFRVIGVNAVQESSWVDGSLMFNNTPFRSVEHTLEKWYNVDIIVADSALYSTSLTGKHLNENLDSMLESITYAIDARYEIKGRTIIIRNE